MINGSFRHAVLCGQNWIAIIAIWKNENIRRKENWTEMAWKLQPLICSEEPFFFFETSSWVGSKSYQSSVKNPCEGLKRWNKNNQFRTDNRNIFQWPSSPPPPQNCIKLIPPLNCYLMLRMTRLIAGPSPSWITLNLSTKEKLLGMCCLVTNWEMAQSHKNTGDG